MSATITLDDEPAQRSRGATAVVQARLRPAQERILAQLIYSAQQSAPGLRFAAVPIDELRDLPIFVTLGSTWRRSQEYLRRAAREWHRRAPQWQALDAAAEAAISEDASAERTCTARELTLGSDRGSFSGLLGALALERMLMGEARTRPAAQDFIREFDAQLRAFDRAYPASVLEQLDIQRGRRLARDHFIRAGLHLAERRASTVAWCSRLPREDLVQIGAEGLIHAVDRFDPSYGAPFAAYANSWIKQAIARGERSADLVPMPHRLQAARGCIGRATARALADGSAATSVAIATRVGLPERVIEAVMRANDPIVSLDGVAGRIVKHTSADDDAISAHDRVHNDQRRQTVRRVLATVGPREREVLVLLFGIGCAAVAPLVIARKLGITRQRVSQIYKAEIRRLRRPPVLVQLKDFA